MNQDVLAKGGLEISFVKENYCNPFIYPTPFELHFSPAHLQWFYNNPGDYVEKMNGKDKDLAAHFMIIKKYGVTIYGREITNVFDEVPREDYMDSIWSDIKNASKDILDHPVYVILNLCRVMAYLVDGLILSKEKGGEWGLAHVEERYHVLVRNALNCYRSKGSMVINKSMAEQFANTMLKKIRHRICQT